MNLIRRSRLSTHALPLLGALGVGAIALALVWWMLDATRIERYDPAKHHRVRVVTVDQDKIRECLERLPAGQRASEQRLRCDEAYVYERGQDFFIPKEPLASP